LFDQPQVIPERSVYASLITYKNNFYLLSLLLVIQATFIAIAVILTGCTPTRFSVNRVLNRSSRHSQRQVGGTITTFMGESLQGKTASGEILDEQASGSAPSYPMGTVVRVTNLESAQLRFDYRPLLHSADREESVIIDLSSTAAELGFVKEKKVNCVSVLRCLNGEANALVGS